jgi:hypothetical protein
MSVRMSLILALAACGESIPRASLVDNPAAATPEIQAACALTEHRCTRCHTIGRALAFDAVTREQWEPVVHRMRQMASSGITRADAEIVLDCLAARSSR